MQVAALPTPVHRAANSRPTPELSPLAANRLTLIEQWEAMRGEGITAAKAADILRVPRASLYRWKSRLRERGLRGLEPDSRRPRNVRRPQREPGLVEAILAQRTAPPWRARPSPSGRSRWTGAPSFRGRSRMRAQARGILLFVLPPALPEVERACGAGAQDACRGVLQLLRRGVDDGAVEPRAAGVGGVLQRGAPASVAWLVESDGVSCGASPGGGLLNPLICMGRVQQFDHSRPHS